MTINEAIARIDALDDMIFTHVKILQDVENGTLTGQNAYDMLTAGKKELITLRKEYTQLVTDIGKLFLQARPKQTKAGTPAAAAPKPVTTIPITPTPVKPAPQPLPFKTDFLPGEIVTLTAAYTRQTGQIGKERVLILRIIDMQHQVYGVRPVDMSGLNPSTEWQITRDQIATPTPIG